MQLSERRVKLAWKRLKENDCQESRQELIKNYEFLVHKTWLRTFPILGYSIDKEDLIGVSHLALVKAVDKYVPNGKATFMTYAIYMMKKAMLEYIRETNWVPRLTNERKKKYESFRDNFYHTHGRKPTDTEYAEHMGISEDMFYRFLSDFRISFVESTDNMLINPEDENGALFELKDKNTNVELDYCKKEESHILRNHISNLPPRERNVLQWYYEENMTFKAIATKKLNISESRVYQLHNQALVRLKKNYKVK